MHLRMQLQSWGRYCNAVAAMASDAETYSIPWMVCSVYPSQHGIFKRYVAFDVQQIEYCFMSSLVMGCKPPIKSSRPEHQTLKLKSEDQNLKTLNSLFWRRIYKVFVMKGLGVLGAALEGINPLKRMLKIYSFQRRSDFNDA